eukprot:scaffold523547_cov51-Attheya_sp.AAC.1
MHEPLHVDCVSHEDTGGNFQCLPLQVAEEGISCGHSKYLRIKKRAFKKKSDHVWRSEGCPYDRPGCIFAINLKYGSRYPDASSQSVHVMTGFENATPFLGQGIS